MTACPDRRWWTTHKGFLVPGGDVELWGMPLPPHWLSCPSPCIILTWGKGTESLPNIQPELLATASPFLDLAKDKFTPPWREPMVRGP